MKQKHNIVETELGSYKERNLAQLIRRRMMSKTYKDKSKYYRKIKHKKDDYDE